MEHIQRQGEKPRNLYDHTFSEVHPGKWAVSSCVWHLGSMEPLLTWEPATQFPPQLPRLLPPILSQSHSWGPHPLKKHTECSKDPQLEGKGNPSWELS